MGVEVKRREILHAIEDGCEVHGLRISDVNPVEDREHSRLNLGWGINPLLDEC